MHQIGDLKLIVQGDDCKADLVERFGDEAEKVPEGVRVLPMRLRVALLRVDQIGELQCVTDEEHGRVVAHHVPDAIFRVKLKREPARISGGIGEPGFASNSRESCEHGCLLPDLAKKTCLAQICHITVQATHPSSIVKSDEPADSEQLINVNIQMMSLLQTQDTMVNCERTG